MRLLTWFSMMMIIITFMSHQCTEESSRSGHCEKDDAPSWLSEIIDEIKSSESEGRIIQYRYKERYVFLISHCSGCPDAMDVVYTCEKEEVCKFGGIAGFNTCPDFDRNAEEIKVIWENQ